MRSFLLCGRFQTTFKRPLTPSLKQDMHNVSWYCPKCPKYSTFDPRFRHFHQNSCLKWKDFLSRLPCMNYPQNLYQNTAYFPCCDNSAARRIFHEIKTNRAHEINLFNFFLHTITMIRFIWKPYLHKFSHMLTHKLLGPENLSLVEMFTLIPYF